MAHFENFIVFFGRAGRPVVGTRGVALIRDNELYVHYGAVGLHRNGDARGTQLINYFFLGIYCRVLLLVGDTLHVQASMFGSEQGIFNVSFSESVYAEIDVLIRALDNAHNLVIKSGVPVIENLGVVLRHPHVAVAQADAGGQQNYDYA